MDETSRDRSVGRSRRKLIAINIVIVFCRGAAMGRPTAMVAAAADRTILVIPSQALSLSPTPPPPSSRADGQGRLVVTVPSVAAQPFALSAGDLSFSQQLLDAILRYCRMSFEFFAASAVDKRIAAVAAGPQGLTALLNLDLASQTMDSLVANFRHVPLQLRRTTTGHSPDDDAVVRLSIEEFLRCSDRPFSTARVVFLADPQVCVQQTRESNEAHARLLIDRVSAVVSSFPSPNFSFLDVHCIYPCSAAAAPCSDPGVPSATAFSSIRLDNHVRVTSRTDVWGPSVEISLVLWHAFCRHFQSSCVTVADIPMRDSATSSSTSYSVPMLTTCPAESLPQTLVWRSSERKISVRSLVHTRKIEPVVAMETHSAPSQCLLRHICSGKTVTLSPRRSDRSPSHVLFAIGTSLFIGWDCVVADLSIFQSLPVAAAPRTEPQAVPYRLEALKELLTNPGLSERDIEERTRIFPLTASQTILWNTASQGEDLRRLLSPIVQLRWDASAAIESAIATLHEAWGRNDTKYFPALKSAHTVRYESYRRLWSELRQLTRTFAMTDRPECVPIMRFLDRLRPGFTEADTAFRDYAFSRDVFDMLRSDIHQASAMKGGSSSGSSSSSSSGTMKTPSGLLLTLPSGVDTSAFSGTAGQAGAGGALSAAGAGTTVQDRRDRKASDIQRDAFGNPVLPIHFGALVVESLGSVVWDRPSFYTDKYIWPVGYSASRQYMSTKDAKRKCKYTMTIRDGGQAPVFVLWSEDDPLEITGNTATAVWTVVVNRVKDLRGEKTRTNVSGPEYFGLAYPAILQLVQELPNAKKVPLAIWADNPEAVHIKRVREEAGEGAAATASEMGGSDAGPGIAGGGEGGRAEEVSGGGGSTDVQIRMLLQGKHYAFDTPFSAQHSLARKRRASGRTAVAEVGSTSQPGSLGGGDGAAGAGDAASAPRGSFSLGDMVHQWRQEHMLVSAEYAGASAAVSESMASRSGAFEGDTRAVVFEF